MPPSRARVVKDLSTLVQGYARFHQLRRRDKVCRHGITVSQCYALEAVAAAGRLSVGQLATALGLNKSSASRVADALAAAGLVTFAGRDDDGRAKDVTPTSAGATLAARIHRDIEVEHARALRGFSERDLRVATRLLTTLMAPRTAACTSDR